MNFIINSKYGIEVIKECRIFSTININGANARSSCIIRLIHCMKHNNHL